MPGAALVLSSQGEVPTRRRGVLPGGALEEVVLPPMATPFPKRSTLGHEEAEEQEEQEKD